MSRRLAVGIGVVAGTALLVAGVGSAGLIGLHGSTPGVVVTSTPTAAEPSPGPVRPTPAPLPADPVPAEVLLAQEVLDPAALPVRLVDRAAAVVEVYDETETTSLLAFDASAGEWVRLPVPTDGDTWSPRLSPDGRAVLRLRYTPEALVTVEVVSLATGRVSPVALPVPDGRVPEDCSADDAAWASNGRVGIVSGCLVPTTRTGAGDAYDTTDTWVHEVDLATGGVRVVEHVRQSAPLENNPAYSPDGRLLVYGIGYGLLEGEDEEWETLRVTQVDGSGAAQERFMTHIVRGDPWADDGTVLGWDDTVEFGEPDLHVLVDARTGETTPLGVVGLANVRGFVAGRLVAEAGPWSPETAPVTLAVVDLDTGGERSWLAVPQGSELGELGVARDVVTP